MEFDRSLLDKEGAPTEEEMREYFVKKRLHNGEVRL